MEVTKAVASRIERALEQIVASSDPEYDRFLKGMIQGYRDFLNVQIDESPELIDIERVE